jgi:hypothetical protein
VFVRPARPDDHTPTFPYDTRLIPSPLPMAALRSTTLQSDARGAVSVALCLVLHGNLSFPFLNLWIVVLNSTGSIWLVQGHCLLY